MMMMIIIIIIIIIIITIIIFLGFIESSTETFKLETYMEKWNLHESLFEPRRSTTTTLRCCLNFKWRIGSHQRFRRFDYTVHLVIPFAMFGSWEIEGEGRKICEWKASEFERKVLFWVLRREDLVCGCGWDREEESICFLF